MHSSESTCWTMIQDAARGGSQAQGDFARKYSPVILAYLTHRWKGTLLLEELDNAVHEVFVDCFRRDIVLRRVDSSWPGGFRAFFHGVLGSVARRFETRHDLQPRESQDADFSIDAVTPREEDLASVFDRAWAEALLRQSADLQASLATRHGEAARRRVDLLTLRFRQGLAIPEIAEQWGTEADRIHSEYAAAREEFREAFYQVVEWHQPGPRREVERECRELLLRLRSS